MNENEQKKRKSKKHKKQKERNEDEQSWKHRSHKHKHGSCKSSSSKEANDEDQLSVVQVDASMGTPEKKTLRLVFKMCAPSGKIQTVRTATIMDTKPATEEECVQPVQVSPPSDCFNIQVSTEPEPVCIDLDHETIPKSKKPKKSKHKKHKRKHSTTSTEGSLHKKHHHHHHHHHRSRSHSSNTQDLNDGANVELSQTYDPNQQENSEIDNCVPQSFPLPSQESSMYNSLSPRPEVLEPGASYASSSYASMNLPFSPPNDGLGGYSNGQSLFIDTSLNSFDSQPPPPKPLSVELDLFHYRDAQNIENFESFEDSILEYFSSSSQPQSASCATPQLEPSPVKLVADTLAPFGTYIASPPLLPTFDPAAASESALHPAQSENTNLTIDPQPQILQVASAKKSKKHHKAKKKETEEISPELKQVRKIKIPLNCLPKPEVAQLQTSETSILVAEKTLQGMNEKPAKSSSCKKKSKGKSHNFTQLLNYLWKCINKKDAHNFFAHAVSDAIAPGYSSIIQHPMDLGSIKRRMGENVYKTLGDFQADVKLMCDNALRYNRADTIYFKAATKLWHYTKSKLFKRDALLSYAKNYTAVTQDELSLLTSCSASTLVPKNFANGLFIGTVPQPDVQASALMPPPKASLATSFTDKVKAKTKIPSESHESQATKRVQTDQYSFPTESQATKKERRKEKVEVEEEMYDDGMTASEIVAQAKRMASMAAQRLRRLRPGGVHYSVLQETQESSSILQVRSLPVSGNHCTTLNLDSLNQSSESGRIDVEILPKLNISKPKLALPSCPSTSTLCNRSQLNRNKQPKPATIEKQELLVPPPCSPPPKPTGAIFASSSTSGDDRADAERAQLLELARSLLPVYGNHEFGLEYALSIGKFACTSDYTSNLVCTLLNILTTGGHKSVLPKYAKLVKDLSL